MNIPFVDLKLHNNFFKKKFIKNFNNILENSNFIKGKNNLLLEKKICKIFKCKYSLNVNSGTDALIIAIKSLDLKSKSEIITTSNTWISSAYAIELNDCKPVFVDVNPDTFQIDCNLIRKKLITRQRQL
jgi:dTDP-4-amino-4,6-dideoxygalactose transaminase